MNGKCLTSVTKKNTQKLIRINNSKHRERLRERVKGKSFFFLFFLFNDDDDDEKILYMKRGNRMFDFIPTFIEIN